MKWNLRGKRRGRRSLLAVVTAAIAATSIAAGTPALAAGSYDDTGPGSSTDHTGSINTGGGSEYQCGDAIGKISSALYKRINGKWVLTQAAGYPNCPRQGGYGTTGVSKICAVGYEVYRFYGTEGAAKPTAVTRSRLNTSTWCADEPTYTFPGQTTWDATPGTAPGLPDYKAAANSVPQSKMYLPEQVGRRENGNLTPSAPTIVSGTCKTVSKDNPLRTWLPTASAVEQIEYRRALGQAYEQIAVLKTTSNGVTTTRTYPKTGAAELGLKSLSGYYYSKPNSDPTKAPVPDPKGPYFYASQFTWETRDCATPFNFAQVSDAITKKPTGKKAQVGTCYIPLMRSAKEMKNSRGQTAWAFQEAGAGGGERYSVYYKQRKDLGDAVPKSWRDAMKADYLKRSAAAVDGFFGSRGQQIVPGEHYSGETNPKTIGDPQGMSASKAADELQKNAKCRFATEVALELPKTVPPKEKPTLQLVVQTPKVLQSGGRTYQATFRVVGGQGQLLCSDGKPCGTRATLKSLSYTMDLIGKNGFTKCAAGQVAGCDYRILSATAGSAGRDGVLTAEFYNATKPTENVDFVVSNIKASYEYTLSYSGLTITGYNPNTGAPYRVSSGSMSGSQKVDFTPTLVGKQVTMKKSGTSYSAAFPVIGTVNVPVG